MSTPLHIAIDGGALGSGRGGDETCLRGLLRGIGLVAAPGDSYVVYVPRGGELPAEVDRRHIAVRPLPGSGDGVRRFGVDLPRALRHDPTPDAVVSLIHAPVWSPAPRALLVPDLSFVHHPEYFRRSTRLRLAGLVPRQARQAELVLTVSEYSRDDLVATFGLDPAEVAVVPNTIDEPVELSDADRKRVAGALRSQGIDRPYVLALSNLHPRKNLVRLLQAFERAVAADASLAEHLLVVAGGRWWGEQTQQLPDAGGRVRWLGRVDDVTREYLLHEATALAYPSLFEGFGLPPIEAMRRDTPVLTSRVTAIPEVVGDAAVLVDPYDIDDIAAGLVTVVTDDDVRQGLVVRGRGRVAAYSPERTGRALRSSLQRFATSSPASRPAAS